jgi:TRAP transporter TAXI family solute receptor
MQRHVSINRAVLTTFCGLLATTPVWADPPQEDQFQTDQFQDDQPQPKHKKRVVRRVDPAVQLRHTMREEINNGLLSIVSEGTDYTVDLALSLAGEQTRLRLLPIAGAGALQNAKDVMFARGVDFGIVQSDVLDEIKRNPPFSGVENYLQYVTKLYDQDLHVLAGPDIQSLDDLRGKKVNFGLRDSGTSTTAKTIFNALGVEPDVTNLPHPLALDKLRRGEISALVYVATKPSRLFQDIRPDENLHFLPITGNRPAIYTATSITSDDYPELVSKDAPVNTVAVGTVLVVYNWPTKSERHQRVDRFVQAFFAHLSEIKARRPKWQDFDISASVSGWTRFPAAEQWLKNAGLTPEPDKATAQEHVPLDLKEREALFREFADYQGTPEAAKAAAHLDPKRREALFRDFAEYQKTHRVIVAYRDTAADH